jgi:hypothetical protein
MNDSWIIPRPMTYSRLDYLCAISENASVKLTDHRPASLPGASFWVADGKCAHWAFFVMCLVTFGTAFYYCSVPVAGDSDLWWHMAIGRDLVSQHTLIPDHSVYTWTDVDPEHPIYNTWLPQILFYEVHRFFGVAGLQVFRYAMIFSVLSILFLTLGKCGGLRHPPFWVIPLCCFLPVTHTVLLIKPEVFSYLFFTIIICLWVLFKKGVIGLRGGAAIPLIMLLWANSHGVWVFGAIFLFFVTLGEWLNPLIGYGKRMEMKKRLAWTLLMFVSAAMVLCNPYGWNYPLDLLKTALGMNAFSDATAGSFASIVAFDSVFSKRASPILASSWYLFLLAWIITALQLGLSQPVPWLKKSIMAFWFLLIPFLGLMLMDPTRSGVWVSDYSSLFFMSVALLLVVLALGLGAWERNLDLAWLLPLLFLGLYSSAHVRSMYYGILMGFCAMPLLFDPRVAVHSARGGIGQRMAPICIVLAVFFVSGLLIHRNFHFEHHFGWAGWGIDEWCADREADYVMQHYPEVDRVGNDYVSGGHLIWKFNHQAKVMIDARAFPFHRWFPEYLRWSAGSDPSFPERYPADLWVISPEYSPSLAWFLNSSDYQLDAIGPCAFVFVRKNIALPRDTPLLLREQGPIRSSIRAMQLGEVGIRMGNWEVVRWALESLDLQKSQRAALLRLALEHRVRGHFAYQSGDYLKAVVELMESMRPGVLQKDPMPFQALMAAGSEAWSKGNPEVSLSHFLNAEFLYPQDYRPVFNVAVVASFLAKDSTKAFASDDASAYLKRILDWPKSGGTSGDEGLDEAKTIVASLLNGSGGREDFKICNLLPESQPMSPDQGALLSWLDAGMSNGVEP